MVHSSDNRSTVVGREITCLPKLVKEVNLNWNSQDRRTRTGSHPEIPPVCVLRLPEKDNRVRMKDTILFPPPELHQSLHPGLIWVPWAFMEVAGMGVGNTDSSCRSMTSTGEGIGCSVCMVAMVFWV